MNSAPDAGAVNAGPRLQRLLRLITLQAELSSSMVPQCDSIMFSFPTAHQVLDPSRANRETMF